MSKCPCHSHYAHLVASPRAAWTDSLPWLQESPWAPVLPVSVPAPSATTTASDFASILPGVEGSVHC